MNEHQSSQLRPYEYAASILGISMPTLRRRVADGTIRVVRIGSLVRISDHEIERVIGSAGKDRRMHRDGR